MAKFLAYVNEGGRVARVTFKHESGDDINAYGPAYAYSPEFEGPIMKSQGAPDAKGLFYLGWHTRRRAQAIAEAHHATFDEA